MDTLYIRFKDSKVKTWPIKNYDYKLVIPFANRVKKVIKFILAKKMVNFDTLKCHFDGTYSLGIVSTLKHNKIEDSNLPIFAGLKASRDHFCNLFGLVKMKGIDGNPDTGINCLFLNEDSGYRDVIKDINKIMYKFENRVKDGEPRDVYDPNINYMKYKSNQSLVVNYSYKWLFPLVVKKKYSVYWECYGFYIINKIWLEDHCCEIIKVCDSL